MATKEYKDFDAITSLAKGDLVLIQQASDDVNKKITFANLIKAVYPVGTTYIQYYGMSDPATLYGGTWSKKYDSEAVFFRTEGSASTTYEARAFDNNIQDSQMQNHLHTIGAGSVAGGGSFTATSLYAGNSNTSGPTTDGTNGTPRTGLETRPRNRCIRIWERTA